MKKQNIRQVNKICYQNGKFSKLKDELVVEQPLSLQVSVYSSTGEVVYQQLYWLTLRTPDEDMFLIIGYLLSQGVIRSQDDIIEITSECDDKKNEWNVTLTHSCLMRLSPTQSVHVASASCGLCGSTSIKSLELNNPPQICNAKYWLKPKAVFMCAEQLTQQQCLYQHTGGVHGAALFDSRGTLLNVCEDIGRHNALDKLLGKRFLDVSPQSTQQMVMMSSRASFDILQKIVMSGVAVLMTVGAPSDLAVKTAQRFGITLIGFVRNNRFNVYHDQSRLLAN